MVKKVDLHFPLGLEVTARNMKGVTIKDALDAIYKQFKKKVNLSYRHPDLIRHNDPKWGRIKLIIHLKHLLHPYGIPRCPIVC